MGRKIMPGRFKGLQMFTAYCRGQVALEGEAVMVLIAWSGSVPKSGRREVAPGGLFARYVGVCPEHMVQIYEVSALAFADAADQGRLVESHLKLFPPDMTTKHSICE